MNKLPEKSRKPIDNYKPTDYDDDAPSEADPRVDDGKEPTAPTNVAATKSGETVSITFQPSANSDIVGYRIYRSDNHGKFQLLGGKVVLAGADAKFVDTIPASSLMGYYVTAVDVAGKESVPSRSAYTDGSSLDSLFVPSEEGTQVPGSTISPAGPTEPPSTTAKDAPGAPTGLKAKADGAGITLSWKANAAKEKVKKYNVYFSNKEKAPIPSSAR